MVAIRLRPLDDMERKNGQIWKILSQQSSVTQTKTSKTSGKPLKGRTMGKTFFTFDKTFGEEVNTKEVYDSCAKDIVKSTVNGLNGTIFAYGQTASGKTHTMQGSGSIKDESFTIEGGIIHMAAKDIFLQIQSQQNRIFLVRVSFFEIYNEEVRDLLSSSNEKLQVRHDGKGEICVQSVEEAVTDCQSLMTILFNGEKSRAVAATSMNQRSSRSHTIFRITIESREKDFSEDRNEETHGNDIVTTGAVRVSTLNLVDLAGSENVKRTGATGKRQKEGRMINQR